MKEKIYSCFDWKKVQEPVDCVEGNVGCVSCWRARKIELPTLIRALETAVKEPVSGEENLILTGDSDLIHYWGYHNPIIKLSPDEIKSVLEEFYSSEYVINMGSSWEEDIGIAIEKARKICGGDIVFNDDSLSIRNLDQTEAISIILDGGMVSVLGNNNKEVLIFTTEEGVAVIPTNQ